MSLSEDLGTNATLLKLVHAQLDKSAEDPASAGVVGQPIPAEMVQQGAGQMTPAPGAASGAPPQGGEDPIMMIGALLEQLGGAILEQLTLIAEGTDRVEKQLIMISGMQASPPPVEPTGPLPQPAAPKTAGVLPEGDEVPARGRDGAMSSGQGGSSVSLRERLQEANSLARALAVVNGPQ